MFLYYRFAVAFSKQLGKLVNTIYLTDRCASTFPHALQRSKRDVFFKVKGGWMPFHQSASVRIPNHSLPFASLHLLRVYQR